MHVARGRRAGGDGAALAGDEHRGTEGLAARVLEDDVDVFAAGELADGLAEAQPFLRVLLGAVLVPELEVHLGAVDDLVGTHAADDLGLLLVGDDTNRVGAAVERVLRREAAEAAGRAPDQDVVALLHVAAVLGDELAVGSAVDQAGRRGLFPGQVLRLWHELVGLDHRDVGEATEVGLEAPDALRRVKHRVVVAVGSFELDGQTVGDDTVAGLPLGDAGSGLEHDAGQVGADDVVRQVVPLAVLGLAAVALEEAERGDRLEDRRPHGVVVDGRRHDGDERLARTEFRERDLVKVERLARILVLARDALEHVGFVLVDGHGAVGLGELERRRSRRQWCRRRGSRRGCSRWSRRAPMDVAAVV